MRYNINVFVITPSTHKHSIELKQPYYYYSVFPD